MTIDPEGEFMKGMIERTLKEAEKKIVPTYFRESSLCTKNKKTFHVFAKVIDKFGKIQYLSANNEDEIDKYCDGGVLGDDLAVCDYAYEISPFMVSRHFKWVGKGHNPYRISLPHDYADPNKKPMEKW